MKPASFALAAAAIVLAAASAVAQTAPVVIKASTVIDLTGDEPALIREGCGDPTPFLVNA